MKTEEDAKALAQSLVETGKRMGKSTAALLTDMNQPLGWAVGNSLEVIESIEALKGSNQSDFVELCLQLCSIMFKLGKLSNSYVEGRELAIKLISSGKALDKFIELVEAQGGDARIVDDSSLLPRAKYVEEILAPESGYLFEADTQAIGTSVMYLGAGRRRTDTEIDHSVGVEICVKLGDRVDKGDLLCRVFYNASGFLPELLATLRSAFKISSYQPVELKLIREIIE
jgi:thymidine phosphorylase